jgi:hypothetical protein
MSYDELHVFSKSQLPIVLDLLQKILGEVLPRFANEIEVEDYADGVGSIDVGGVVIYPCTIDDGSPSWSVDVVNASQDEFDIVNLIKTQNMNEAIRKMVVFLVENHMEKNYFQDCLK